MQRKLSLLSACSRTGRNVKNTAEICETVAKTRRLTRVSAAGLVTFTRVSVVAVTAEEHHFFHVFVRFQLLKETSFRKYNFMLTWYGNTMTFRTDLIYISVDVIRPKLSR